MGESSVEYFLEKSKLPDWLAAMSRRYRVVGPVHRTDGHPQFEPLLPDDEVLLNNQRWAMPPKDFVLPRCETLFTFQKDGGERVEAASADAGPTVLFGAKACDMRSLQVLDRVFLDGRFTDPYYQQRRADMLTVAYACERKRWSCFCSSVGDPVEWLQQADVVVTDVGDGYVLGAVSQRAGDLLEIEGLALEPAGEAHQQKRNEVWEALRAAEKRFDPGQVASSVDWEAPEWQEVARKCIGCGVCSFICPTCTCFDIQDEALAGGGVERFRVRDTCQFCDFTKMGHGHNPRPTKKERTRQRVSHKFKYILQQCGISGCTGCGRCVELCPVNSDLRDVLQRIMESHERQSLSA